MIRLSLEGERIMISVIKRDGEIAEFKLEKVSQAIKKAFHATDTHFTEEIISLLALRVTSDFQCQISENKISVEEIQDSVERVLNQTGYVEVAKSYILYRKNRERIRNMKSTILDYKEIVDSYVKDEDWRVKENSTVTYSVGGLILHNSGSITANYWLSEIYDDEIANAHRNADIHIHDLSMLTGYCAGWSLKQLIKEGLGGIPGKITSSPASHLSTLCNQMVNFLGIMQNEWAGAQAFSSFDTYLAPFVKVDNLSYKEVKQALQEFLFNLNVPTRVGFQSPFTNLTLDLKVPKHYKDEAVIIGGKPQPKTYGDFQKEMDMLNKAFLEVMLEGDAKGRVFSFPIPTYNISKDFDWDNPELKLLWDATAKYGIPYFANFINSDMDPDDARSMCCRLRIDNRELRRRGGGLFGASPLTGSIGVVTLNMPRLGYESKTEEEFFQKLDKLMTIAKNSLETKRKVLEKLTDQNLYPYMSFYLRNIKQRFGCYWKNHFSTIGVVGMNECCLNFLKENIASQKGKDFAIKVLTFMRNTLQKYQEENLLVEL